jgi:hypothetical protein
LGWRFLVAWALHRLWPVGVPLIWMSGLSGVAIHFAVTGRWRPAHASKVGVH